MFRHPLARHIAIVLSLKLLALVAIFTLFFGPDRRPDVTPGLVHHLIFPTPPPEVPATSR